MKPECISFAVYRTLFSKGNRLKMKWLAKKQSGTAMADETMNFAIGCHASSLKARLTKIRIGGWKR